MSLGDVALFERLSTFVTPEGQIGRQYTDYLVGAALAQYGDQDGYS